MLVISAMVPLPYRPTSQIYYFFIKKNIFCIIFSHKSEKKFGIIKNERHFSTYTLKSSQIGSFLTYINNVSSIIIGLHSPQVPSQVNRISQQ